MTRPTLREQIASDKAAFQSFNPEDRAYSSREIRSANGVSPGSSFSSSKSDNRR